MSQKKSDPNGTTPGKSSSTSSSNKDLASAKRNKKDEFCAQITDIKKELVNYKSHLKDAVVFSNYGDPLESNFFRYFALNSVI